MQTTLSANLTALSSRYAAHTGISLATLSERAAGDWKFFALVAEGKLNYRIRSYDRAMQWFSDNWPADAPWPVDVPRPSPACVENQEAKPS